MGGGDTLKKETTKGVYPVYKSERRKVMKKKIITIISAMVLIFAFTAAYAVEGADPSLMTKENLVGKEVKNNQGEELGKISNVEVDPQTNEVAFAMIASGDKLIPVPVKALTVSENNVILNMSKEKFEQAPKYSKNDLPAISDRAKYEETYRYFGIQPQWEEKGMKNEGTTESPKKGW